MTPIGSLPVSDIAYGQIETNTQTTITEEVQDTEALVRAYFRDVPIMAQVARCESTFRHTLKDGSVLRGRVNQNDIGVMQINTYYHGEKAEELGLDLYTIEGNLMYARYLYERKGTQPWSASAPCWSRTLAQR